MSIDLAQFEGGRLGTVVEWADRIADKLPKIIGKISTSFGADEEWELF